MEKQKKVKKGKKERERKIEELKIDIAKLSIRVDNLENGNVRKEKYFKDLHSDFQNFKKDLARFLIEH